MSFGVKGARLLIGSGRKPRINAGFGPFRFTKTLKGNHMREAGPHSRDIIPTPSFDVPLRGRYEANATIFQKRKLEVFASEFRELPERFYELIDTLGREQASQIIDYCERRALEQELALESEQRELEDRQRRREHRRLLWGISFVLFVGWTVYHINFSGGPPRQQAETRQTPSPTPAAVAHLSPPPSQAFLVDVRYSQQAAAAKYPQLSVAGSPLNQQFLARYNEWKARHDPRLGRSDWPQKLADDCVTNP